MKLNSDKQSTGQNAAFDFALFLFWFLFLIIVRHDILNVPYFWDGLGGTILPALSMYDNNFRLFSPEAGNYGHGFMQHLPLVLVWKVAGYSLVATHAYSLFLAALGLTFVYKLGVHLFNVQTGLGAMVLTFFNQIFFAHMGTMNDSIPLLTFGVMTVYFYTRKNWPMYVLFGCVAALFKETAAFLILAIFLHFFYEALSQITTRKKIEKRLIVGGLVVIVPLIALAIWSVVMKFHLGWAIRTDLLWNKDQFGTIFFKSFREFFFHDPTHRSVNTFNWILVLGMLASAVFIRRMRNRWVYPFFFLIIVLHTACFSFTVDLPRYFVPLFPFFYIPAAYSLYILLERVPFRNAALGSAFLLIGLSFTTNYYSNRNTSPAYLESNLEYHDVIETQWKGARFIETHFPDETVFAAWPMYWHTEKPRLGYVSQPIKTHRYDRKRHDPFSGLRRKGARRIVYYSPQSNYNGAMLKDLHNAGLPGRLTLLKQFEKNRKRCDIYLYENL